VDALQKLPEKERLVLALHYYEGLSLTEIAGIMELSTSRISQLHAKAILRMRGRLGRKKALFF
jgi:RNA polymerase sigma factor for flagellar operon FliA